MPRRGSPGGKTYKLMKTAKSPNPIRQMSKMLKKSTAKSGTGRGHAGPGVAANKPKKRSR
jgi:hypothetical protein